MKNKLKNNLYKIKDLYCQMNVDNMNIIMKYSETNKKFSECMLEILKHKMEKKL